MKQTRAQMRDLVRARRNPRRTVEQTFGPMAGDRTVTLADDNLNETMLVIGYARFPEPEPTDLRAKLCETCSLSVLVSQSDLDGHGTSTVRVTCLACAQRAYLGWCK